MKVLLCVAVIGLLFVDALNQDEREHLAYHGTVRRAKRALCGAPKIDRECRYCNCYRNPSQNFLKPLNFSSYPGAPNSLPNVIFGKRAFSSYGCADWNKCCNSTVPRPTAAPVNVSSLANSLLHIYGKRAAGDDKFKKPSVDLIFVIDDSGSIQAPQFTVAKEGAAILSQSLCPHTFGSGKGEKQVSVALFSTTATTMLTYEESHKGLGYVEDKILGLKQRGTGTATTNALRHVRNNMLTQPGNRLNDPDTATIVFVVTDGQCTYDCYALEEEARKLRETGPGVQVFAFGVGEADCDELELIRGKEAGEVYGLPSFDFFEKMANAVKEQMAKNSNSFCLN